MTGYKPRQISHLNLSIHRFAEAHDCYCDGRYTVEVYIHPSHIIILINTMHQRDVCYDEPVGVLVNIYYGYEDGYTCLLKAGELINLTRSLEMKSQTTSWPLPSNTKKVSLGMATFLRKNIHRTNKMLYNNQLWYY